MKDRAGMRGAAEEVGEHEHDELRRAQRLADGHGHLRVAHRRSAGAEERRRLRTRSAAGIMRRAATAARISSVVRQLTAETSQAARDAMVMGAMPMPAETSDTARLRWVSNQPVTQAIMGTMMAAALPPTRPPKIN